MILLEHGLFTLLSGMSCDFTKSYSTISEDVQRISQEAFIKLYEKGYIYSKDAPTTWCVKCQTAIAQAEFENVDIQSKFTDIAFTSSEGDELVISTTRPELIPACVALFAHPDDKRYKHLKGKTAKIPLFDENVPILFDEAVEEDKGTGLMMVCTFGDKEDIDKWAGFGLHISLYILFGIIFSFIIEHVIHWRHCHHPTSDDHPHPFALMNLVGDGIHNFQMIIGTFLHIS